jgi:hypothetical protein
MEAANSRLIDYALNLSCQQPHANNCCICSDPSGGRVLNKRFYSVVNNTMIMVSFNCAADEVVKRKYEIEQSINSVQIKD